MNMKMSLDDQVSERLKMMVEGMPKIREQALAAAAGQLVNDAVRQPPTPPIDTGLLRASWSIHVGNKRLRNGSHQGKGGDSANIPSISADDYTATVAFNTPYARYQHEGVSHSGKPLSPGEKSERAGNTGPKFLEQKVVSNHVKYGKILAKKIAVGLEAALRKKIGSAVDLLGLTSGLE